MQNYSYTWITKEYHSSSNFERIIGLTASPGSDLKKILEVCKNLYSKEIEIRIESDPDVKQYVQEVKIEKIIIEIGIFSLITNRRTKSINTIPTRIDIMFSNNIKKPQKVFRWLLQHNYPYYPKARLIGASSPI